MRRSNLAILIFTFTFCVYCNPLKAQLFKKKPLSPAKMCYKINKNRVLKVRKKIRVKKKENDISRISYKPYDRKQHEAIFRSHVARREDILTVPELIETNIEEKNIAGLLPNPVNDRHSEIRKLVEEKIKDGSANEPILESLFFLTDDVEFAYVDFDPFLLAVEFALQGKMVLVEGHTDDNGAEEYNLNLSMKRVRQIENLMHDIGVPEERVSVIGYGESMPKYDNSTEEGRQKNRRVDFKIF